MPTLVEYFSFVFYASGPIVGPIFEFCDFKNWIEFEGVYKDLPRGGSGITVLFESMKQLLGAFLCLGIYVGLSVFYGLSIHFCGTQEFRTWKTIWHRIGYYFAAMTS